MKKLFAVFFFFVSLFAYSQQYTGMAGLIQTPSAEMDNAGDARVGAHFLNGRMLPGHSTFKENGKPYNTGAFYISLTPFSWIECAYTITLMKGAKGWHDPKAYGFNHKDQHISLKVRPLKEGKWWPAVVVGTDDPGTTAEKGNQYFANFYAAATKHVNLWNQTFGATVAYRYYLGSFNSKWRGVCGGITYRPSFYRDARAIVEWTGHEINFGIDCLLFRHLLVQASLTNGKYFSGGLCYKINLF